MKIIQLLFLFLTNTIIYSQKIPDSTYFYTYENDRIRDWTRDHYNKIGDTIHITREDFDFDSSKFKNHQLIKEVKSNCKNVSTYVEGSQFNESQNKYIFFIWYSKILNEECKILEEFRGRTGIRDTFQKTIYSEFDVNNNPIEISYFVKPQTEFLLARKEIINYDYDQNLNLQTKYIKRFNQYNDSTFHKEVFQYDDKNVLNSKVIFNYDSTTLKYDTSYYYTYENSDKIIISNFYKKYSKSFLIDNIDTFKYDSDNDIVENSSISFDSLGLVTIRTKMIYFYPKSSSIIESLTNNSFSLKEIKISNTILSFKIDNPENSNLRIQVIDYLGRNFFNTFSNKTYWESPTLNLNTGLHLINVTSKNGTIIRKVIVH